VCRETPAGRTYAARRHGREPSEMGKFGRSTGSVVVELMRLRCLSDRPFIRRKRTDSLSKRQAVTLRCMLGAWPSG
jgi:hypothetical protein